MSGLTLPGEQVDALRKAVERSGRKTGVQLPIAFVRDLEGRGLNTPLSELLKGGGTQLKTYLTLVMMATKFPYDVNVAHKSLATMLYWSVDLGVGARKVARHIKLLSDPSMPLVKVDTPSGKVSKYTVLDPAGNGKSWSGNTGKGVYIGIPISLWSEGWISKLSPRGLGLYLVLLELTRGSAHRRGWAGGARKRSYALSDDTWTRATRELEQLGLLEIHVEVESVNGEPRKRNVYHLIMEALESALSL